MNRYSNVNIVLEYIENYDTNAPKLIKSGYLDMMFSKDTTYSITIDNYYYNFFYDNEIDYSNTTSDVMDNYTHIRKNSLGEDVHYIYSLSLGGEVRGTFVNVRFLNSLGLNVPTNYNEFMSTLKKIQDMGYVPIQGSPASAGYGLGIPAISNDIVNDEESYHLMMNAKEGSSKAIINSTEKLYQISKNRYYDYIRVETDYSTFKVNTDYQQIRDFLGLGVDESNFKTTTPNNNIGNVAFFPYLSSYIQTINMFIDKYKLDSEIKFILSPLNDYYENAKAYFTPTYGIVANKNSNNLIWIREFVNFLLHKDNIISYADEAGIIPNSKNAVDYLANKFNINSNDCTLCGKILFSDSYNCYYPISNLVRDISKCNNKEKYMIKLIKDASGNIIYNTDEALNKYLYLTDGSTKIYKKYVGEEDKNNLGYAFCSLNYFLDAYESQIMSYGSDI